MGPSLVTGKLNYTQLRSPSTRILASTSQALVAGWLASPSLASHLGCDPGITVPPQPSRGPMTGATTAEQLPRSRAICSPTFGQRSRCGSRVGKRSNQGIFLHIAWPPLDINFVPASPPRLLAFSCVLSPKIAGHPPPLLAFKSTVASRCRHSGHCHSTKVSLRDRVRLHSRFLFAGMQLTGGLVQLHRLLHRQARWPPRGTNK